MAVQASVVTVLTTPTLIASGLGCTLQDRRTVLLTGASAALFIGGTEVTTAAGFPMADAAAQIALELGPGDSVFGIVATGSATVRVLVTR
jgi:hypothetical protein